MRCSTIRSLDLLGYGETWIHRRDSRAKLIATLVFLVCIASFPKYEVAALIPLFLVPLIWSKLGDVPLTPIFKILFAVAPFAILLGAFNPLLDRVPMISVAGVTLSAGWISFSSILVRFVLSVGITLLLIATTSMPQIFKALRLLRIPRIFVVQLDFLYRYLFVLIDEGDALSKARSLRDPRNSLPSMSLASVLLSTLLVRSIERSHRVYSCMQARGFQGEVPVLHRNRLSVTDFWFVFSVACYCLIARFLPLTYWLGSGVKEATGF